MWLQNIAPVKVNEDFNFDLLVYVIKVQKTIPCQSLPFRGFSQGVEALIDHFSLSEVLISWAISSLACFKENTIITLKQKLSAVWHIVPLLGQTKLNATFLGYFYVIEFKGKFCIKLQLKANFCFQLLSLQDCNLSVSVH